MALKGDGRKKKRLGIVYSSRKKRLSDFAIRVYGFPKSTEERSSWVKS